MWPDTSTDRPPSLHLLWVPSPFLHLSPQSFTLWVPHPCLSPLYFMPVLPEGSILDPCTWDQSPPPMHVFYPYLKAHIPLEGEPQTEPVACALEPAASLSRIVWPKWHALYGRQILTQTCCLALDQLPALAFLSPPPPPPACLPGLLCRLKHG